MAEQLCSMVKHVHHMLRGMLLELRRDAAAVAAKPSAGGTRLARQAHEVAAIIHKHHWHEDHTLFPWYKETSRGKPVQDRIHKMVDKLDTDHRELEIALRHLHELADKMDADATTANAEAIGATTTRIIDFLFPHLQYEEDNFTPRVLNEFVTPRDLDRLFRAM